MKVRHFLIFFVLFFLALYPFCADGASVESFSPQGTIKGVRQARARFSEQMVPLGDPRGLLDPFEIDCPGKGAQRWADGKNWVYDFESDLPAGIRCEFRLKPGLKALSGADVTGKNVFSFSTGGPAALSSYPNDGGTQINEDQVFVLNLDSEATGESVLSNAYFAVEGVYEKVGVDIITGKDRDEVLKSYYFFREWKNPLVIRSRQRFPAEAKVNLVWGKGVSAKSGVSTEADQVFHFQTRGPFTATFHCARENPESDCVPVARFYLNFSAPVQWKEASRIVLKGPDSKVWKAGRDDDEAVDEAATVSYVAFQAPLPEVSDFTVEIPPGLMDDSGRPLSNADKFPLAVRTDEYPPLVKFPANFGIIELKAEPALPVTLRNVEPDVAARLFKSAVGEGMAGKAKAIFESIRGKTLRISGGRRSWEAFQSLSNYYSNYAWRGERSVFGAEIKGKAKDFTIHKPNGAKAFEVVGIPLKEPGFYVVEIESYTLGSSVLGKLKPAYVSAAALVTNMSAHLKWGRESSLIWVTALDSGAPVKGAAVEARDCRGEILWEGVTDDRGTAKIDAPLKEQPEKGCDGPGYYRRGIVVTVSLGDDMTFVHSDWDNGIEPWRFQLTDYYYGGPETAHTVFDRTLLRAGETVHMKHVARRRTMYGFSNIPVEGLPKSVVIYHYGSGQRYTLPLKWDAAGVAETEWEIPRDARLGNYEVILAKGPVSQTSEGHTGEDIEYGGDAYYPGRDDLRSGSFRVEEFRVPLMKGIVQPPSAPLIAPSSFPVDLTVRYLAGGGAGGEAVKFRSLVRERHFGAFDGFDDFIFANGPVAPGRVRLGEEPYGEDGVREEASVRQRVKTEELRLDATGSARTVISGIPGLKKAVEVMAELEFRDPNGEIQTVSSAIPVWPSSRIVGIRPDSWALSKDSLKVHLAVIDTKGRPVKGARVIAELFERKYYTHRKRLVGGFYSYESQAETRSAGRFCEGYTDERGLLICESPSRVSGEVIIQASSVDDGGNESVANRNVWVAGGGDWWYGVSDSDRMDLLPEKKRYEPGEVATFQVRMPFREATVLVTVEREGVMDVFVRRVSGKSPAIKVPVKGNYAPNVYISALAVRGRITDVQPTALVDLGRPAHRLGISEINVGWRSHELKVKVKTDRDVYRVREKAKARVVVRTADGKIPPKGTEVALAAVDEGLLELLDNTSWDILSAMMGRRPYEIKTSTAQMYVVGKRHFGLKAVEHGGGGGRQTTRELFDTLLLWKGRVALDPNGEAVVEVPLNDSITGFRIAAVAVGSAGLFGSATASIRSTQDLMIFSGASPLAREGDSYAAEFTVRNTTGRAMEVDVSGSVTGVKERLRTHSISLRSGESKVLSWDITAPPDVAYIVYEVEAKEKGGKASDRIKAAQKIVPAVPVRTLQATITRVEKEANIAVRRPDGALSGRGGVNVSLSQTLSAGLEGVREYMRRYPYVCLEQKVSRAVALRDENLWKEVTGILPNHLDADGLAKYFPGQLYGSDTLTSYILAIANEAGLKIPAESEDRMIAGLKNFVEGSIVRRSSIPSADLSIRKIAAIEALSRVTAVEPGLLSSISIEPNLWPTSAVIDWFNAAKRVDNLPGRDFRIKEAEDILKSRLDFHGTVMGFSTEKTDYLWWLMVSGDLNAVKLLLSVLDRGDWKEDMPRLVRGLLSRQRRGAWDLTTANAWGVLAMEKFSSVFEGVPVTGVTGAVLSGKTQNMDWNAVKKRTLVFHWTENEESLAIRHNGTGRPWAIVQSLAAVPLKEPFSSGYRIKKTVTPIEQKEKGRWTKGDIARVRIEVDAQSDMTWVVVSDPIPAGATILGSGLGRDSSIASSGEKRTGRWAWPAFEERSFEAFRSYYEYVPKGSFSFEYTMRLNQAGSYNLQETRAEALYSPEMFGESPNDRFEVER